MSNLIERQMAIDELIAMREHIDARISVIGCTAYEMAIEALREPEIIRCKDCKYYGCILYSGTQFEYGECFGHEESDYTFEVKPDDFCSRAERRIDERTD